MRVPWQHFQASPCSSTAFAEAGSIWAALSLSSWGALVWTLPTGLSGCPLCSLYTRCLQEGGCGAEDCGFHHVLMTPALYILLSPDPLRAAKQFVRWLMKMEIWIKAHLSRSGWGNACRRKQLLHFCLAEDAVFVPPSLSGILLSFPHSFFLHLLFCFLHPGCITGVNFLFNRTICYWRLCYKLWNSDTGFACYSHLNRNKILFSLQ